MIIVFDLDDTLYLEIDFVRSGFHAVDRWLTVERDLDGFFSAAWQFFERGQRARVFDDALAACGVSAAPELIGQLVEVYRDHRPTIELAADARRALDRHAGRGQVALLTDGYQRAQERKIEALGLRARCNPVITTDRWGRDYWKPNPRGFMEIQRQFGRAPADFIYIGDNPTKDFLAPRALGWKSIRIRREGGLHAGQTAAPGHEADLIVSSLDELNQDRLERLLAEPTAQHAPHIVSEPEEVLT